MSKKVFEDVSIRGGLTVESLSVTGSLTGITSLDSTNIDAGASGTAGTLDVFPSTASKGKFTFTCTDQAGDTQVILDANEMGQATTLNLADPGIAAAYIPMSTAQITVAEMDVLDGATAGTAVASKALILGVSGEITGIGSITIDNVNINGNTIDTTSGTLILQSVGATGVVRIERAYPLLSTTASITASTTQTQGQGQLGAIVNEVSTVANANDTVTLLSAAAGLQCIVINNGANTLQIFPSSGDNLGAGVNTATTLAAGSNVRYVAYDSTNWEAV